MQSSSATLAIVLTALDSGILLFGEGAGMVIGANVGTTVTILLGAIGGVAIKKQVAASHVIFNVGTAIVAMLFLPLFIRIIDIINGDGANSNVIDIAIFHTIFNLLGVILFFPFIGYMARLLIKWYPERETEVTKYINNVSFDLPEAGIKALHDETGHLLGKNIKLAKSLLNPGADKKRTAAQRIEEVQVLQSAISVYGSNIKHGELETHEKTKIHQTISISIQLSQISKTLWAIHNEIDELNNSSTPGALELFDKLKEKNLQLLKLIDNAVQDDSTSSLSLSNLSNEIEATNEDFISYIAEQLDHKQIENKHASWLILVNGLLTQTNRQLLQTLTAWKEIKTNES